MESPKRSTWTLGTGDAESVLAEARKALFVMVGFLALLWFIQLINVADSYKLSFDYGIRPRDLGSLPDILIAPFLHVSWTHIEGNSGPLFIFGFLAAYRGVGRFLGLTAVIIIVSGLAAWFTGSPQTYGVGASGLVFGYLGYILVRGFFDRHGVDIMIGLVMALCFAYQFTVLLPHAGIGWQAHIGGLAAGVVGGWMFRDRRPALTSAATASPELTAIDKATPQSIPTKANGTASAKSGSKLTKPNSVTTGQFATGPRAELHKQLDELGY